MVEYSKIKNGLAIYIDQRLMPKLEKTQQFLAGMVVGLYLPRADAIFGQLAQSESVKVLGLIDGNAVDLERLYETAKVQLRKQGDLPLEIPMIGRITLNEADLDELYRTIMNA